MTDISPLEKAIDLLRDAFIDRPVPAGDPFDDLDGPRELLDRFCEAVRLIADASDSSGEQFVEALRKAVEVYHDLWSRPFPQGLERGQPLFGAVMEKPLRILLRHLERAFERESATDELPDEVVLEADEEIERVTEWLDELPVAGLRRMPARPFGFGSLAVSFLLGWWMGGE